MEVPYFKEYGVHSLAGEAYIKECALDNYMGVSGFPDLPTFGAEQ